MKKIFVFFTILVVVFIFSIFFIIQNSKPNPTYSTKYSKQFQETDKEINSISAEKLYYYYEGKKIMLTRHWDNDGIYFKNSNNPSVEIRVSNKLMLSFNENISLQDIELFLRKEDLEKEDYFEPVKIYVLKTSGTSKFKNGLLEANYLYEKYPTVLKFAEPNFISTGKNILL